MYCYWGTSTHPPKKKKTQTRHCGIPATKKTKNIKPKLLEEKINPTTLSQEAGMFMIFPCPCRHVIFRGFRPPLQVAKNQNLMGINFHLLYYWSSGCPDVRLIYVEGVIHLHFFAKDFGTQWWSLTHWNEWDIENPTWNVYKTLWYFSIAAAQMISNNGTCFLAQDPLSTVLVAKLQGRWVGGRTQQATSWDQTKAPPVAGRWHLFSVKHDKTWGTTQECWE